MNEWSYLPEKDGIHYFLKVVDIYRDEGLVVEYEIYQGDAEEPVQIDFFQKEIDEIIEKAKREYLNEERTYDGS